MAKHPIEKSSQPKSSLVPKKNNHTRKAVIDDMAARGAYARAKAWAEAPAGTPYPKGKL